MPPRNAQVAGIHACSIQQIAAHMRAQQSNWPNQGWPRSTLPAARTSPCAGKYMDVYVGCMVMWMLSK